MSDADTVPNSMMMTLIVSEESLARDRHTDSVLVIFLKVCFANNNNKNSTHSKLYFVKVSICVLKFEKEKCTSDQRLVLYWAVFFGSNFVYCI